MTRNQKAVWIMGCRAAGFSNAMIRRAYAQHVRNAACWRDF